MSISSRSRTRPARLLASVPSRFLSRLVFEDAGGLPLTLVEPLIYQSGLLLDRVTVGAGFRTDLASIPRPLWALLPPIGLWDRAAVVHDQLYATARSNQRIVSRAEADAVLKEAMAVCGVDRFTRAVVWAGVRAGGWVPWNRHRRAEDRRTALISGAVTA
jgi:hypothetical protein